MKGPPRIQLPVADPAPKQGSLSLSHTHTKNTHTDAHMNTL